MKKCFGFFLLFCTLGILAVACRGTVSSDDDYSSALTLEAEISESSVTFKGRTASDVDVSQVSRAGFLVSESESFPGGSTLDSAAPSVASDGSFSQTLTIDDLGGRRGVIFYYKAWIERSGNREYGNMRSFRTPVIEVRTITLTGTSSRLEVGNTFQVQAKVEPENATDKTLFWSSSDTQVATVSSSGLVTAVSGGRAIIKASHGDVSGECIIYVKGVQPKGSVDLGFGPYWNNYPLRPDSPSSYYYPANNGPWYRWGETKPAVWTDFTNKTYDINKFKAMEFLPKEYDAASQSLGGSWRLPTREEFMALFSNCTVTKSGSNTGWYTVKFTSRLNNQSFTLDCEGYVEPVTPAGRFGAGSGAIFWSSTTVPDKPEEAYTLYYDYKNGVAARIYSSHKSYGANILAVAD